jgi:TolB-like protein/Tfp pilus assembly protein PilF
MRYEFDRFILDTALFELRENDIQLKVEPQVVALLVLLIENTERMLSKEEIYEKIWPGRFVSESALSSRIKTARQVLGDDGRTQKFIRTIHKKGFRFVAEVKIEDIDSKPELSPSELSKPIEDTSSLDEAPSKPRIAVLPFSNLSADEEQEYFSDGITTDIITFLSKYRWLDVVARNTSFGYKGQSINLQELGKLLKVNYVLEGAVRRAGNNVRVNVQLIDANTGMHKWAERYDREMSDIFALQDEITEKIVGRLEPEIGLAERNKTVHSRPANLQAWDCYHLGTYHLFKFTGADNLEAQKLLRQSKTLDSNFGEPYVWWAYAVILGMIYWDTAPTQDLLDDALTACNTAIELDRQNASFFALRARVLLARREYRAAIAENQVAISLNPTFAAAHCGLGDSLAYEGRYEEAITCFEKAIALSPNDPQLWAFLTYGALTSIFNRDFETALEWTDRASRIPNCQYWTVAHKAVALVYLGKAEQAKLVIEKLVEQMPQFSCSFVKGKLFYLRKQEQISFYIDGLRMAGLAE